MVKKLPTNAGDIKDVGLIPGLGRSPGRGHGNTLQYSCLENPRGGGAWWATVHVVTELNMTEVNEHTCMHHDSRSTRGDTQKQDSFQRHHTLAFSSIVCWPTGLTPMFLSQYKSHKIQQEFHFVKINIAGISKHVSLN